MNLRTLGAMLGATALVAVVGTPALAQSSGTSPSDTGSGTTGTTGTQGGPGAPGRHGGHRGAKLTDAQLTTVATKLGVTLEQLKAAQAKVKAATDATDARETPAERDALLASELGVSAADLKTAFASVRPARGAGGGRGRGDCPKGGTSTGATGSSGAAGTYPSDS